MRHMGRGTPQPPGRTPHPFALRPGGETLLVPGASPRTPVASRSAELRASGTTERSAREGGHEWSAAR